MQTDKRYTQDARFFTKAWGSFEIYDNDSWHGGLDFVSRYSDGDRGFEGDIYQLYMQKELKEYDSTIKAGRFQRADSLGYYAVDGVNYHYDNEEKGVSFQFYAGVPRRLEDARSVDGDWLYGFESQWNKEVSWESDQITVDNMFIRYGFQQFADDNDISSRLNVSSSVTGRFPIEHLHSYEFGMMGTYEIKTSTFEDFMVNMMLDLTEKIRLRTSYELYHPREPYVTFREKFYSQYTFGKQDLLRLNVNNQVNDYFEYHFGFKRAERSESNDTGYGGNLGFTWTYLRDISLAAEIDYLELGGDKSESLYLSADYSFNADLTSGLYIALASNKKLAYGTNQSTGFELNAQYRIDTSLYLKFSGSYLWYSTIENEYLMSTQLTWYFDRFTPKAQH